MISRAAHRATEWPWLADAATRLRPGCATRLRDTLADRGTTVTMSGSSLASDPWQLHAKENE